jgi:hypothetical protein
VKWPVLPACNSQTNSHLTYNIQRFHKETVHRHLSSSNWYFRPLVSKLSFSARQKQINLDKATNELLRPDAK